MVSTFRLNSRFQRLAMAAAAIIVSTMIAWLAGTSITVESASAADELSPPSQPAGLTATAGNTQVALEWDDPGDSTITKYQLLQLVTAKLTASDGAEGDSFGHSVAVNGSTAVVSAYQDDDDNRGDDSGSAYVFTKDSSGKWTQQAKLTASDGAAGDEFGISVAVDGDTVVVGAQKDDDDNRGDDSGSAYVFVKPAGGWANATETAKLTASDGAAGDLFGISVAVDGDTVVVGAQKDDDDDRGDDSGSAYVFVKPNGGWDDWDELDSDDKDKLTAKLTASDGSATDSFGWAVAADSDTVVIGAFGDDRTIDDTDIANLGAAYVFTKPAGGWANATETAKLTAPDAEAADLFGVSVAVDGEVVLVGAHLEDENAFGAGAAYVFTKPAGGWADVDDDDVTKLTASDGESNDRFGLSVAVDGSTAVIGANDHTHGTEKSGSAYVFTKNSAGVWIQEFELNASDGAADDRFGYSVALDGDTLFVGAEQDDDKGTDSGSVHIANITKWSDIADSSATTLTATGLTNDVEHTFQLRAVNDSGHSPEATVTATPTLLPPAQPTGFAAIAGNAEVQLSWIEPQPAPTMPVDMYQLRQFAKSKLTASDATKNDLFGLSVAVDGSTAVVGAPGTVGDDSDSAYLYTKDSSGVWTQIAKLTDDDSATDDGFGYSVAVDGDTVVVGAPNDVTPVVENPMDPGDYANTGSAYVFVKPASSGGWADIDVSDAVKLTASDANGGDRFGHSVAVDGDAVLVGAQGGDSVGSDDVSIVNSGSAYLFTKPASSGGWADIDVSDAAKLTASDANGGDRFGWSVALDSDTAVVGAPNDVTPVVENPMDPGDYANTGSAFVFVKPSGGWVNGNETAKLTAPISDAGAGDWFGTSVAVDGDVVLVGAEFEDEKATDAGSAYVFIKPDSANGWADIGEDDVTKLTVSDGAADDRFGKSVAVDGDTAVIGAYNHDHGSGTNGSAYIFTKNSSGAWIEDFELTASDGATTDSFGLSVALDGNTAVIGAPEDDDSGTDSGSVYMVDISTWTDIADSSATTLTHTATGLTNNIEYTFQLRAANDSGHSPEATATATPTLLPPAQPTGFAAIAGNAQVSLSWQAPEYAPTMPVEGYELWQVAESAKLVESGGEENDAFGDAVAIDGDTAVVGASNDVVDNYRTGAAYIFVRDPDSGLWSRKAKLTAANGAASDSFGISVALDGDTIVVGASIAGSAYVFTEPDEGWADANETAKLTGSASGEFGSTVAVNGNTIVVGADRDTNGDSSNAGSAYVFTRPSDGWEDKDTSTAAKLTAAIPAANDYFGQSVAVDGGTVVVGATGRDSSKGSAYVFTEPDTGVWVNSNTAATLTAPDGETGDEFGRSVAVDGDTVVVGADLDDSSKGSAYVFTEPASDGGWGDWNALDDDDKTKLTAKLTASDRDIASDNGGNTFGSSVAVDGDTVVVGADGVDLSDSVTNSGAAYVFTKPTTGWTNGTEAVKLTASDGAKNDRYGDSVAVDGDTVVIGAHGNKGAAYVVDIDDWTAIEASDSTTTSHTVTSLANDVEYWFRIRAANDIGPGPDSNGASATPRLPKPGKPTGLSAQAGDAEVTLSWADPNDADITKYELAEAVQNSPLIANDAAGNDQFGISVAVDGDIAVIGAFRADENDDDAGAAYIFTKNLADAWIQTATLTAPDRNLDDDSLWYGDQFGYSVAVHGQTVVVGAFRDDHSDFSQAGSAYVFTKPDDGWGDWKDLNDDGKAALTAKLTALDPGAHDLFGSSVAVNGDTVVVGAYLDNDDDSELVWVGSAYVFTKPGTGWINSTETAKLRLQKSDRLPNSRFGFAVAVDGDTVLIGAHGSDERRGSAYIFTKPDDEWSDWNDLDDDDKTELTVKLVASDGAPGDWFGYSVALDGETAVIGARLHNDDRAGAGSGAAYVFTRESGAWTEKAKLTASDGAAHDNFGFSVSVDADTVVAGAWLDDDDGSASGSAYIFKKPEQGWAPSLETTKLTAPDGAANDRFGTSVAVDGKFAAVGAYRKDGDTADSGSVYVMGIPDWREIDDSGLVYDSELETISHTETGLDNGVEYTFQIRALNERSAGPASDGASAKPLGKPAAPTSFTATAGDTQVELSWDKPNASETIAPITVYQYCQTTGNCESSDWNDISWDDISYNIVSDTTKAKYTVTRLTNGTTYTFQVRAVNAIGEGPSSAVAGTPASARPGKPKELTAAAGDKQVHLTWMDPNDSSIDKYEYRWTQDPIPNNWMDVAKSADGVIIYQYTVTLLTNETEYTFKVRAVDNQATQPLSPESEPAFATPEGMAPAKPANLNAVGGDTQVQLSWADPNDSSIGKYEYCQKTGDAAECGSDDWNDIAGSGSDTTNYTVTRLTDGTTRLTNGTMYTFRVRAVDAVAGASVASDPASATPLPPKPDTPDGLRATGADRQVQLRWNPVDTPIDKYQVLHLLPTRELTATGTTDNDNFGYAVAVDGDTAIIGAHQDDDNGPDAGAAYIFTRSAGVWSQTAKLTATDGEAYDSFGISVAINGDTAVIGAHGDDGASPESGSVYVFTRDSSGMWSQTAKLTASDGESLDYFGYSVAMDGDTILVGAHQDDGANDLEDSGSVYVFVAPAAGWSAWNSLSPEEQAALTTKLTALDGAASDAGDGDNFGISVALDGDTAVIGAIGDDNNAIDSGSVYIFTRSVGVWSQTAKLTASDGEAFDSFGYSVAIDGATLVVGAYRDDGDAGDSDKDLIDVGSAYIFTRDSSGVWSQTAKLTASDGEAGDWFGYSVAVDGESVVVGAYGDDDNGSASGSAYLFAKDSGKWSQQTKLTAADGEAGDWFGYSVAVDGVTTVVGAGSAHVSDIWDWQDVPNPDDPEGPVATSFTVENLMNGLQYEFQVRAVNLASEGPESKQRATPQTASGGTGGPPDDNSDPSFVDGDSDTLTVAENTPAGGAVSNAVTATDPDDDTLTYSLSGDDAASFDITASTGQIIVGFGTNLNYESDTTSYSVIVSVHDGKNSDGDADYEVDDSIDVTINVTDVDEALELSGPSTVGYFENETVPVADYLASAPEDAVISWSLAGDDSGAFTISSGVLSFSAPPNYELPADQDADNDYQVIVEASDGDAGEATLEVTVTVTDVNEAPVAADDVLTVTEGASATVLDVITNDRDPEGDTLSVSAVGAASNGTTVIAAGQANPMEVGYTPRADFHGSDSFTYTVSDGNGGTDTATVTVTITPFDPESSDGSLSFDEGDTTTRTVAENAATGTTVGDPVRASDSDGGQLVYWLSGTDRASFDINRETAQLTTKTSLDFETKNEYSVRVRVQDGQGGADEISVIITVLNLDEPPSAPEAPQVSSAGPTGLTVRWSTPDNQGPEITDYDVRYREATEEFQDAGYDGVATSMTLNDLEPATSYEVQVRAVNAEGTSPWSESGRGETDDTEPDPSEGDTEPDPSEGDTEPDPSEGDTEPDPSEGDTEPDPSEGDTEPDPSEGDTEPDPSEGDTEPDPSEGDTEPATSEGDTEPATSDDDAESAVEPPMPEPDSGDRGFPWWILVVIVVIVVVVVVAVVVGLQRHRRGTAGDSTGEE